MKQQTKKVSIWRFGALTTICITLLLTFACTEEKVNAQNSDVQTDDERPVFTIVEEQPTHEGGLETFYTAVMKEVKYPAIARDAGVQGQVYIQFDIERNGKISNTMILRDLGARTAEEAARAIKKVANFKAGSQRGRTVSTTMLLPLTFILDDSNRGSIVVGELKPQLKRLQVDVKYNDGAWHGTLYDNDGNPLPGANIIVAGTNYGGVSGLDGAFSVKAEESQDVTISYIGYETVGLGDQEREK